MHVHSSKLLTALFLILMVTASAHAGWMSVGGDLPTLYDVKVTSANQAVAVGAYATILTTTDGGYTWPFHTGPVSADYHCVAFANPNVGVAAGDMGTIISTSDGGVTWDSVQSGWLTVYNSAFYRFNGLFSVVAGQNTLFSPFLTFSFNNWQAYGSESFYIYHNGSNYEGSVTDITESSPALLFATCSVWDGEGAIVRKADTVWVTAAWMPGPLYALDFPTHDVGYAVGQSGAVLKSTDGGVSWNQLPWALRVDWFGVKFYNENMGWVCGENGSIYQTTDGGSTWNEQMAVGAGTLNAIDFSDSLHGIAVGNTGNIYITFDGGQGGQQPTEFLRLAPADSSIDPYYQVPWVRFQWQASHDPEGGAISYNFRLFVEDYTLLDTILTDTTLMFPIPIPVLDNLVPHQWVVIANNGIRERMCSNGFGTFFVNYEAVNNCECGLMPRELQLGSYPNPFNPQTNLSFILPRTGDAELRVFDVLGREVFTQNLGHMSAGKYNVVFDGRNLSSGYYLAQLATPYGRAVHKLVLMK